MHVTVHHRVLVYGLKAMQWERIRVVLILRFLLPVSFERTQEFLRFGKLLLHELTDLGLLEMIILLKDSADKLFHSTAVLLVGLGLMLIRILRV